MKTRTKPKALIERPFADDPDERRRFGRYYTPAALVRAGHRLLADALGRAGIAPRRCVLVDPCCGTGAFLHVPEARAYRGCLGLDLDPCAVCEARRSTPGAEILAGDAYGDGLKLLAGRLRGQGPVAVIGNPPYVGNSELLKSGSYREVRDDLLPFARQVARGTSIRDDFALFFGVADRLIEAAGGQGAIAYVTSSSLVDNFLYAPMRRWLLERYHLAALVELGPALFEGARVATALSVWVRRPEGHGELPFGHLRLSGTRAERLRQIEGDVVLAPAYPHGEALLLNAPPPQAARTLDAMRVNGDRVGDLFAVTFPGLKTRFDALLTDTDPKRLRQRMREFFSARDPGGFARKYEIDTTELGKLRELFAERSHTRFSLKAIRPFARYAGPPHRFSVPEASMGWVYLDPVLIPRGDHRLHGDFDPHEGGPKLIYNVREVPLTAAVLTGDACVHDYRHARFAPLFVPDAIARHGLQAARDGALGKKTLNLTPAWAAAAKRLGPPADLLHYVCAIVNSRLVQEAFAPVAGASEEVPIPRIDPRNVKAAKKLVAAAKKVPAGGELPPEVEALVPRLFGLE